MADGSAEELEVNERLDRFVERFEARARQLRAATACRSAKVIRFPVERRQHAPAQAAA